MTSRTLHGSCLCGVVQYEIAAEIGQFYFCHCEQCRKVTGSAFAANIVAEPAVVHWTAGAEQVKRFDFPGSRSFSKVFCLECGSGLPFLNEKGNTLYIPAGSLDHDPDLTPEFNIFWEDRAKWYEAGTTALTCKGFPES